MTFVLVHGGNVDASSWGRLVPLLGDGVLAVDLPGRGARSATDVGEASLADFVDAVVEDVVAADVRDAVLVGHSVGGLVLAAVAHRLPDRIARLVFVSGVVPPHGTSVVDHLDPEVRASVERSVAGGRHRPDPAAVAPYMCSDLDEEDTAFVLGSLVDEAASLLTDPVDLTGIGDVDRTYVLLSRDAANPPDRQRASIAAIGGADEVTVDAGHMVMVGRPDLLAAVLHACRPTPRRATGRRGPSTAAPSGSDASTPS